MLRSIEHIFSRLAVLVALVLTFNGAYASSPVEFCIDTEGHVYIIASPNAPDVEHFADGAALSQGLFGELKATVTEHFFNAQAPVSLRSQKQTIQAYQNVFNTDGFVSRSSAYLFYSDLPPPGVTC